LQTESVTYVSQRAEALAGLFYLLTLYAAIRAADSPHAWRWNLLAVGACLLGAASKETNVTAPLVVLVYDRTFLAGAFREAWRRRRGLYLALVSSWLCLAFLVLRTGGRGGTAGFGVGVSPWRYALTQCWAIACYLRLTFWPSPLIFDYGTWLTPDLYTVWPAAMLVAALLIATVFALWRWPVVGFLGVWFWACLAPSSSIVPVATQTIAEHRMYLALAAPVALVVVGLWTLWCRMWPSAPGGDVPIRRRLLRSLPILPLALGAAALALTTVRRNEDYRSELDLWQDTVNKRPQSARAQNDLGLALAGGAPTDELIVRFQRAAELDPKFAEAHYNLGVIYADRGQIDNAIAQYQKALAINPDYADAHNNLGAVFDGVGRGDEAFAQFQLAVTLKPDYANGQYNLGVMLAGRGRTEEAIAHLQKALEIKPDFADARRKLQSVRAVQR